MGDVCGGFLNELKGVEKQSARFMFPRIQDIKRGGRSWDWKVERRRSRERSGGMVRKGVKTEAAGETNREGNEEYIE
jgi:hypothetical protein